MLRTIIFLMSVFYVIPLFAVQIQSIPSCKNNSSVVEFHVSTQGRDSNNGSLSAPFATIGGARDAVRKSGKLGEVPIVVYIHEGTYRISQPILFGPDDSGSRDAPVTYKAANNDNVIITGAQEVTTSWRLWKNGIYRTRIKAEDTIDRLFVNGEVQHMARYPNFGAGFVPIDTDGAHRGIKAGIAPYDGCTPDAWDASKASGWRNPAGAYLHAMHRSLWGSMHFQVTGKNTDESLKYEGGWQNNRNSASHEGYRMIENVFEELDAAGEWYHDRANKWLYYKPAEGVNIEKAFVEVVGTIEHLIEIYGDFKQPVETMNIKSDNGLEITTVENYEITKSVKYIQFDGLHFTGTSRTFMKTIEPLLRSDWTIYRGGAIHLRGTENIEIKNSNFEYLGGNAVFVDGFGRGIRISGNRFIDNGASDVNFVGSFGVVRDPMFMYFVRPNLDEVDTEIGPKTNDYPSDCIVEDNLMTRCGRVEKQVAGVNISMSSRITVRHNTIHHTPRAAINICDGTWGGHVIEWNDCFDTVLETSDHGSFNSWGRDRYWHNAGLSGPYEKDEDGKSKISFWIERYPTCPFWDAYQTTIIRNNRMQCDHGWDIDLDDGSSNYEIYNNLCLSGGIKTREGYGRIVKNNIILHDGFDCRVPYPKPVADIFIENILWGKSYRATSPVLWGGVRNANFYHNPEVESVAAAINMQGISEDDGQSLYGNAMFTNPAQGDFTILKNSPALQIGFKNFKLEKVGVFSEHLKELAGSPTFKLPEEVEANEVIAIPTALVLGAEGRPLLTKTDLSATGMFDLTGFILINVPESCKMAEIGYQSGDVILEINGNKVHQAYLLRDLINKLSKGKHQTKIMRGQQEVVFSFEY